MLLLLILMLGDDGDADDDEVPGTVEEDVHLCQIFRQIENILLSTKFCHMKIIFWHIFAFNKHSFLLSFGTLLLLLFYTVSSHLVNFVTFLVTSKVRTVTHRFSLAASDARFSSKSPL